MPDYGFYTQVYLGSCIPEKAFDAFSLRAKAYLDRYKRSFRVQGGENAEQLALCAMAETLYRYDGREGLKSMNLGGVQVQYDDSALRREVYRAACVYLDIYRGVAG